jgi:hypothetical protein
VRRGRGVKTLQIKIKIKVKRLKIIIIWRAPDPIKVKMIIRRAPRPYGASPTQPYKCGRNVKVKVKDRVIVDFDVDFNVLTALKGWVGQAAKRTGALLNNYRSRALQKT